MTTMLHRRAPRLVITALVVVVAILGCLLLIGNSGSERVTISAMFADASPLVPGNRVQLDGVQVGTIKAVTLEGGAARVDMDVDPGVLPLHTDATAKIMPVSLLGERFVALERGTPAAQAAAEPVVIPVERTSAAVDLDQLLNTLDDPTSTALAALITTLGEGVAGQGDTAAAAIKALQPATEQTSRLAGVLDQQNATLEHLIVQSERNFSAAAPPLDGLVDSTNATLRTVADKREVLDQALRELPGMLGSTQRTLGTLGSTADVTTQNLASLRPLTDNLTDTSKELKGFSDAAQPALASLSPTLDKLNAMLDDARPVVDALGPAARDLNGIAGSIRPLADDLFRHKPGIASGLENLMTGAAEWAMATSGYDGISHYFAGVLVATPNSIANSAAGALPPGVLPNGFAAPTEPDPNNPNAHDGGPGLPSAPVLPRLTPLQEQHNTTPPTNSGDGTPTPPGGANDGATGLSPQQEQNMFNQMLGGGR